MKTSLVGAAHEMGGNPRYPEYFGLEPASTLVVLINDETVTCCNTTAATPDACSGYSFANHSQKTNLPGRNHPSPKISSVGSPPAEADGSESLPSEECLRLANTAISGREFRGQRDGKSAC